MVAVRKYGKINTTIMNHSRKQTNHLLKMVSVAVITVDSTLRKMFLDLGIRLHFNVIYNYRPVIIFEAKETDKEMLIFLELPCRNTENTPLVFKY
jgi:hypothetical protein